MSRDVHQAPMRARFFSSIVAYPFVSSLSFFNLRMDIQELKLLFYFHLYSFVSSSGTSAFLFRAEVHSLCWRLWTNVLNNIYKFFPSH